MASTTLLALAQTVSIRTARFVPHRHALHVNPPMFSIPLLDFASSAQMGISMNQLPKHAQLVLM